MPTATVSRPAKTTSNGAAPKPAKAPRLGAAQRRRPAVWGAGGALVAVGAAIATSAALSAGAKHDVLALTKPVSAGRMLTTGDLRTVRVAADSSVATIAGTEEGSVVGQRTTVDLVAHSLLNPGDFGGAGVPGSGQALVGVSLKPGQLPGRPLSRGDKAELVPTPAPASAAGSSSATTSTAPAAAVVAVTVDAEGAAGSDGTTVVDLVLPAAAAPAVAARAAAGQLVLVLLPRSGS